MANYRTFLKLVISVVFSALSFSTFAQLDFELAKKKCAELGFKAGTERFGSCVLQLSKPDEGRSNTSATSANEKNQGNKPQPKGTLAPVRGINNALGSIFKDCDDCPEMVVIPAGRFLMGADPFASSQPSADEQPQHAVSIKSFAMGKYEVTQEQWYAVMGTTPSQFKGRTLPVEQVSWGDAQEFVKKLSEKTGKNYRLPSEAEWEYAARAGTQTAYSFGDNEGELGRHAWFSQNSNRTTHPVGEKQSNSFGLHDMHGNVYEWTQDCWNGTYNAAPTDGSAWTKGDCSLRVVRGGSWNYIPQGLRAALRFGYSSAIRSYFSGFRVARDN